MALEASGWESSIKHHCDGLRYVLVTRGLDLSTHGYFTQMAHDSADLSAPWPPTGTNEAPSVFVQLYNTLEPVCLALDDAVSMVVKMAIQWHAMPLKGPPLPSALATCFSCLPRAMFQGARGKDIYRDMVFPRIFNFSGGPTLPERAMWVDDLDKCYARKQDPPLDVPEHSIVPSPEALAVMALSIATCTQSDFWMHSCNKPWGLVGQYLSVRSVLYSGSVERTIGNTAVPRGHSPVSAAMHVQNRDVKETLRAIEYKGHTLLKVLDALRHPRCPATDSIVAAKRRSRSAHALLSVCRCVTTPGCLPDLRPQRNDAEWRVITIEAVHPSVWDAKLVEEGSVESLREAYECISSQQEAGVDMGTYFITGLDEVALRELLNRAELGGNEGLFALTTLHRRTLRVAVRCALPVDVVQALRMWAYLSVDEASTPRDTSVLRGAFAPALWNYLTSSQTRSTAFVHTLFHLRGRWFDQAQQSAPDSVAQLVVMMKRFRVASDSEHGTWAQVLGLPADHSLGRLPVSLAGLQLLEHKVRGSTGATGVAPYTFHGAEVDALEVCVTSPVCTQWDFLSAYAMDKYRIDPGKLWHPSREAGSDVENPLTSPTPQYCAARPVKRHRRHRK